MVKQNENNPLVVLFVEGDTDEVLFKALVDYYRSVSTTELNPCKNTLTCRLISLSRCQAALERIDCYDDYLQ